MIRIGDTPIYLVNTQLNDAPPEDIKLEWDLAGLRENRVISRREFDRVMSRWRSERTQRREEVAELLEQLQQIPGGSPVIIGGDFAAQPDAAEMRLMVDSSGYLDAYAVGRDSGRPTWDTENNTAIRYAASLADADGDTLTGYDLLMALYNQRSRRVDYLLLNRRFTPEDVHESRLVLDLPEQGLYPSDHFGVQADILLSDALRGAPRLPKEVVPPLKPIFETLPVASYDKDLGLGLGFRSVLVGASGSAESFELTLFQSTEGEGWYRFGISWPDQQLRQHKQYPFGLDLSVDYRKMIRARFYGVGQQAPSENLEYYTREPIEVALNASTGVTPSVVAWAGVRYRRIENRNVVEGGLLEQTTPAFSTSAVITTSLTAGIRYDTRDSHVNPTHGYVFSGEAEIAPHTGVSNALYSRLAFNAKHYWRLWYPTTTIALQAGIDGLVGDHVPVQILLPLGGPTTLRGAALDRYLDKVVAVLNAEARFPIVWRFGAVVGLDMGRAWSGYDKLGVTGWKINPVAGLRFHWDRLILRADVGFGDEDPMIWVGFGQAF
jgi:hypothetical protein